MSSVMDEQDVMTPAGRGRLVLADRVRSLRRALEDVGAARRDGQLMFAVPSPDLASLSDLDLLIALLPDPTRLRQVPPGRIPALVGMLRVLEARLVWGDIRRETAQPSPPTGNDERLLTADEVSKFLNVPKSQAYELLRKRAIPVTRIGRRYVRVRQADLKAYLEQQHEGNRRDVSLYARYNSTQGKSKRT